MSDNDLVICGVVMVIGLVGIVVPMLPGLTLIVASIAVWAVVEQNSLSWVVLGAAMLVSAGAQVAKYLIPGKRMSAAGVPRRTIVAGGLLGIVGFFVIPVVGLLLGFVLGAYLAERVRLRTHRLAWPSTRSAIGAVGLSILIELAAGLLAFAFWLAAIRLSN